MEDGIECDGSGLMVELCETLVPHAHCWNASEIVVGIRNGENLVRNWGDCGEPLITPSELARGYCGFCLREENGLHIHNKDVSIFETRQRHGVYSENSGTLGHSPFRRLSESFLFGETEVVSQQEQTIRRWKAKNRKVA